MKFNDQFFKPASAPEMPPVFSDNPFRCFHVRCLQCGVLRLILIAEFDYESGEIAVVRHVASRKICRCQPPDHRFDRRI
jgi:hypothetical protein